MRQTSAIDRSRRVKDAITIILPESAKPAKRFLENRIKKLFAAARVVFVYDTKRHRKCKHKYRLIT